MFLNKVQLHKKKSNDVSGKKIRTLLYFNILRLAEVSGIELNAKIWPSYLRVDPSVQFVVRFYSRRNCSMLNGVKQKRDSI